MEKLKVINTIKINGKEYDFDKLPTESRKEIGIRLSDKIMEAIGYQPVKPRKNRTIELPDEALYVKNAPESCNLSGAKISHKDLIKTTA